MRVLFSLIVLAITTGLGVLIARDPGYALFTYGQWSVELPLWLFVSIALFSLYSLFYIHKAIHGIFSLPYKVVDYCKQRTARKLTLGVTKKLAILDRESSFKRRGQWADMINLIPDLKQQKLITDDEASDLAEQSYLLRLKNVRDRASFESCWREVPKALQGKNSFSELYVRFLIQTKQTDLAEKWIKSILKKSWFPDLVHLYGGLELPNFSSRLKIAEGWQAEHPHDMTLLLCLAKLSLYARLWGKAREYLDKSFEIRESAEGHALMGELLEQLAENEESRRHYKKGMNLILQPSSAYLDVLTS